MNNPDFRDMLSALNAEGVEYLIAGAHALAGHGHVRATGDLDIWVRADARNAEKVAAAFEAFAPLLALERIVLPSGTISKA